MKIIDKLFRKKELAHRQVLLDQISNHFKKRFEEETTSLSISYPVSFVIYLHPEDYKKRRKKFKQDIIDAVTMFYRHIDKYLENSTTDFLPNTTNWQFQFVEFEGLPTIKNNYGETLEVKEGEVVILSDVHSADFSNDNIQVNRNVKSTFHTKDSAKLFEINNESLITIIDRVPHCKLGLKYSDEDRKKGKVTERPTNPAHNQQRMSEAYAALYCHDKFIGNNKKGERFLMYYNLIEITGKNDARSRAYIAKVDSDKVMNSHVQIKYIPEIQTFQLAAFGTVKLNERTIELSSDDDIHWHYLPNNSDIFINNIINVKFKIMHV